eukprot:9402867-Karenia_brevis.AAC.1
MKESTSRAPILRESYVRSSIADVSNVDESNAPPPAPFSPLPLLGNRKRKQSTSTEDKQPEQR